MRGYVQLEKLNYLKNIVNNFILDFEKKAYSRGDGI